ncbi:MAG: Ig-like domain-containing protein, partial [Longimicrobiales bacterium]
MNSRLFRPLALAVSAALTLVVACNELNVLAVDVAEVEVIPDTAMVTVGGTRPLGASLRDASGNLLAGRIVEWSTSDPARVQIEPDGRIVGVSPGTAVITATSGKVTGDANVTVVPAIALVVDSAKVTMAAIEGSTTAVIRTTGVRAQSGGPAAGLRTTITYSAGQPTGWLEASLLATTSPTTLRLTGTVGALRQGVYQAAINIESSTPGAQAVAVTVEFRIGAGPAIRVASTTASFTAAEGAGAPPTQNIAVTNSGGGTLSGLGASVTYTPGQPVDWLIASLS